ncbi:MAG: mechanosensitive ion channel family protein [Clostridia bacterium]|nr:mechanosensitive ion channel family protein [Clostridia bacterium]
MENVNYYLDKILHSQIIISIAIAVLGFVIYRVLIYILNKSEKRSKASLSNKGKTYIKLIKSILRYCSFIITGILLLKVNGVDVSSVLAGVGIVGVIFGLAIQDWLKDIIRGGSILSDNYFSVGDVVNYKGIEGKVLVIGLKTTKIKELKTGYVKSIANRNIDEIDVVSNLIYVSVPMPYELSVAKAEEVINNIVTNIKENNNVNDCEYVGINEFADSSISYYLKIDCNQLYKWQVRRDALRTALLELERNGIAIPYTQIDIHEK